MERQAFFTGEDGRAWVLVTRASGKRVVVIVPAGGDGAALADEAAHIDLDDFLRERSEARDALQTARPDLFLEG